MYISGNRDLKNPGSWASLLKILSQRNFRVLYSQSNLTYFKREARAKGNHQPPRWLKGECLKKKWVGNNATSKVTITGDNERSTNNTAKDLSFYLLQKYSILNGKTEHR